MRNFSSGILDPSRKRAGAQYLFAFLLLGLILFVKVGLFSLDRPAPGYGEARFHGEAPRGLNGLFQELRRDHVPLTVRWAIWKAQFFARVAANRRAQQGTPEWYRIYMNEMIRLLERDETIVAFARSRGLGVRKKRPETAESDTSDPALDYKSTKDDGNPYEDEEDEEDELIPDDW